MQVTHPALNPGLLLTAFMILGKLTSQASVFSFVRELWHIVKPQM